MSAPSRAPVVAISTGDPAGIGPEVTLKALADPDIAGMARFVVFGDAATLQSTAERLAIPVLKSRSAHAGRGAVAELQDPGGLDRAAVTAGRPSAAGGQYALACVRAAAALCVSGRAAAMVTGPVSKEAVVMSGRPFTGHTEYIAELCGAGDTRMMLANDRLRVVHVTTHCSLREATQVTEAGVARTIELADGAARALGFSAPRIAVCGLNPHAGEHGLFGREDVEVICQAVGAARAAGIDCSGPHPADTLFLQAVEGRYQVVVAMYHDQGHIPMKLLDFEHTVNVTLGLPIIRTSVDHGTAFDIAGQGVASAESMKSAIEMAVRLAHGVSTN